MIVYNLAMLKPTRAFTAPARTTTAAIVRHGDGADYAYRYLRTAIVEQRFAAGERLVEQRLSEELGLSRTPIREALRRLDAEGLVTVTANRGATVRGLTIDEVVDLYGLRAQLESYAAGLAAERMSPDELVELTRAVEAFGAACEHARDRNGGELAVASELSTANARVHEALVAGAHHTRLQTLLQGTVDAPLVFGAFRVFGPAERRRSDVFHRLILEAVAQHDGGAPASSWSSTSPRAATPWSPRCARPNVEPPT